MPKIIKALKVPKKVESSEDFLARFCYHFPQYTFAQARRMPFRRVVHLMKIAEQEKAKQYAQLVQIVSAPHTKNGSGVKKMLELYKSIIEGN